jgi:hypothetical protein
VEKNVPNAKSPATSPPTGTINRPPRNIHTLLGRAGAFFSLIGARRRWAFAFSIQFGEILFGIHHDVPYFANCGELVSNLHEYKASFNLLLHYLFVLSGNDSSSEQLERWTQHVVVGSRRLFA